MSDRRRTAINLLACVLNSLATLSMASRSSVASMVPIHLGLGQRAKGLPATACRRAIGGPSFVVFVAQLEPTAVAKFPEAAVAKFTSEPEAAVAEFPEAAVAKSAAVEPEDTGSGSEANAVTAKVSSAEATSAKVRPAKAAPAEAASAVTEATSTAKGRRT